MADPSRPDDETIAELLRGATPRRAVPEAFERRAYAELEATWRQVARRRRRFRLGLAAAASLAVIAAAGWVANRTQIPGAPLAVVATIERLEGPAYHNDERNAPLVSLGLSSTVAVGDRIVVPHGSGVAMRRADGLSLRLDADTSIRLDARDRLTLARGRLYIDAPRDNAGALAIATPLGVIRHVGTQYGVEFKDGNLDIVVREGLVAVDDADGSDAVAAGERLRVSADGSRSQSLVRTFGDEWLWAERLGTLPEPGTTSIRGFLDWVARETGRRIDVASPEADALLDGPLPRGRLPDAPLDAMADVLLTAGLTYRFVGPAIVIDIGTR